MHDEVHICKFTAAHEARDQSRRDPPRTNLERGPERVRRGASSAPNGRHEEPGS